MKDLCKKIWDKASKLHTLIKDSKIDIRTDIKYIKLNDSTSKDSEKNLKRLKDKFFKDLEMLKFLAGENIKEVEKVRQLIENYEKNVVEKKSVWQKFDPTEVDLNLDLIYPERPRDKIEW